jgi:hypothetical protein
MRTVEMSLRSNELSGTMAEMRMWLDEHRFEPSSFCCRDGGAEILVRVDFKVTIEAHAFADRFRGRVDNSPSARGGRGRISDFTSAPSPVRAVF